MTEELVIDLGRSALWTVLMVGAPMVGLALTVGLVIGILQATTQVNEQTLAFVPKIVAVLVALIIFGPWMVQVLTGFTEEIFMNLPAFSR